MFQKHPVLSVTALIVAVLLVAFAVTGATIMNAAAGKPGQFQYLLVLGTTVNGDQPSPMLRDRIQAAYDYMTVHPEVTCIVTGYRSGSAEISEAECMYRELTALGIAPDRIWMEPNATSTLENLDFSLDLIEEKTGTRPDTLGILSSEFHLLRAGMFADEYGISYVTVPAKTSDPLSFLLWLIREIVMVWYYSIF